MTHLQHTDTTLTEDSAALLRSAGPPRDAGSESEDLDRETLTAFDEILDDQIRVSWMQDRQRWEA